MANSTLKVAVSYSWKEEAEGPNAGQVEGFCQRLKERGIEVVRDKERMKHGESISVFMRSLGASDFLCVFLSDRYLKSPNCMYELLIAWQRSRDNPEEFRKRVKVWVMPGAGLIREHEGRGRIMAFWRAERARLESHVKETAPDGLGSSTLEEYRRVKEFAEQVDPILQFFSDQLSPESAGEFRGWIESCFPLGSAEAELARVYANTIRDIENDLNRWPGLRDFLLAATPTLIHEMGGTWRLSAAITGRQFDLRTILNAMVASIRTFRGQVGEWSALGDVAGGLLVLSVNRDWVLRERVNSRRESSDFPGDNESVSLGGARQANLLHVVISALADGRARLEKLFGKPPLDETRLPDVAGLPQGIGEEDQLRELKVHFIRCILGPSEVIDPSNPKLLGIQFGRAKAAITAALEDDHAPYVATGEKYRRLTKLIRFNLDIQDLLMVHPSGEDPSGILPDYVPVLRALGKIFDVVRANSRP